MNIMIDDGDSARSKPEVVCVAIPLEDNPPTEVPLPQVVEQYEPATVVARIASAVPAKTTNTTTTNNSARLLNHLTTTDWAMWILASLIIIVSLVPFLAVDYNYPYQMRVSEASYAPKSSYYYVESYDDWAATDLPTNKAIHDFLKEKEMAVVYFYFTNSSLRTFSLLSCLIYHEHVIQLIPRIAVGQVNCATNEHIMLCPERREQLKFYQGGEEKFFNLPCVNATFYSRIYYNDSVLFEEKRFSVKRLDEIAIQ